MLALLLKGQTVGSCTIRCNKYNVDGDGAVDAGSKDDSKSDAARRSTSFMRLLAQLSKGQRVASWTIRREEYDVDEDGGE